jgi:hypothetical protein
VEKTQQSSEAELELRVAREARVKSLHAQIKAKKNAARRGCVFVFNCLINESHDRLTQATRVTH